jgi:predicted dehydrogenase
MPHEPLRIGFVGAGLMGQCAHLRNYASLEDCRVVALAELREQLGQRVAQRYNVPKAYRDHRQMLASEKLDAIVASQLFTHHGQILPELIASGLPIFIEKPLAGSVPVAQQIVKALGKKGKLMVGYHKRSDPATIWAKEQIEQLKSSGELGRMRYVRITMPPGDWIQGGFDELVRTDEKMPELASDPAPMDMDEQAYKDYVTLVNYYIHQINLTRHLLGEPYRVTFADPSGVLLTGISDSGVGCAIEMAPYHTTRDWRESALVGFDRGYVELHLPAPVSLTRAGKVKVLRDPGKGAEPRTISPDLPSEHAMRRQAINFLRFVRGQAGPTCGAVEALADLEIARDYIRMFKAARA